MKRKKPRRGPSGPPPGPAPGAWWRRLWWCLPALLATVVYLPALDGGRVWDDSVLLDDQIPAFRSVRDAFFPPDRIDQWPYQYYRPAATASYLLDRAVFGPESTRGLHATVVLLHVASTIGATLLAALALRGFRHRRWGALAAGALFAAHPIHTESVCWITGRTDPLAAAFLFPALALAVRYRDRRSKPALLASALLFLASALSKEIGLAGLALLPLWLALVPGEGDGMPEGGFGGARTAKAAARPAAARPAAAAATRLRRSVPLLALWGVAALGYLGLRLAARPEGGAAVPPFEGFGAVAERAAAALAYYLAKVVVPAPQSAFVTALPGPVATVLALAAATGLAVWAVRRFRRGQGVWLLALASFLVAAVPSLQVVASGLSDAPAAERYLYLPSLGLCIGVGAAVAAGMARRRRRGWIAGILLVVVAAASAATVRRSRVWRSDLALWSDTVERAPDSGLAWGELGKTALEAGDLERALECYRKAVERKNDATGRSIAYNSIGAIRERLGRPDEALRAWRAAVAERADNSRAHVNLGNFLAGRAVEDSGGGAVDPALLAEARAHLARAAELNPRKRTAWIGLVWCDAQQALSIVAAGGDAAEARAALARAEASRAALEEVAGAGSETRAADTLIGRARAALRGL